MGLLLQPSMLLLLLLLVLLLLLSLMEHGRVQIPRHRPSELLVHQSAANTEVVVHPTATSELLLLLYEE
jgi:hypothetical protein